MNKYLLSFLLASTVLSGSVAMAEIVINVDSDRTQTDDIYQVWERTTFYNPRYHLKTIPVKTDSGAIVQGSILHMNTNFAPDSDRDGLEGTVVENHGIMETGSIAESGPVGWSVFADVMPNQRATTVIYNYGDMYRINLGETGKASADFGDKGSEIYNNEGANLYGSILMGTYGTIENRGIMMNLDRDGLPKGYTRNNLIYFDKRGILRNGFTKEMVTLDPVLKSDSLAFEQSLDATITTDNIIFGQSGTLYNAGTVDNKRIVAFDSKENVYQRGVKIYLMNNPYYETNEVILDDSGNIDRYKSHLKYFVDEANAEDPSRIRVVEEKPILHTHEISLGDDAVFRADQGSEIAVKETFNVGENADINIGANYYWKSSIYQAETLDTYNWDRGILVQVPDSDEPEPRELNAMPRRSSAMISEITTGSNARVTINNTDMSNTYTDGDGTHIGGSLNFADNVSLDVEGSRISLQKDSEKENSGHVHFGKQGSFKVAGYIQEPIEYSDNETIYREESIRPPEGVDSVMSMGGSLDMGKNAYLELHSELEEIDEVVYTGNATLDVTGDITLADYSTIQGTGSSSVSNYLSADALTFADYGSYNGYNIVGNITKDLNFGNFGFFSNGHSFYAGGNAIFKDDGVFNSSATFTAKKLDMNERSTINIIDSVLNVEAWVHNDSVINLVSCDIRGCSAGITNGLFKKKGAENVILNSTAANLNVEGDIKPIYNENYVLNGVKVDDINILSGGLRLGPAKAYQTDVTVEDAGDIYGTIHMNSDTWVRFTGNKVVIHDPIERNGNAKNTLVWVDLADDGVIETHNTIDSDVVMIGGGTLDVKHLVTAPKVILDDAGALRVYNTDLIQADVMEYETAAANTTVFIAPEKESLDSFGSLQLDRLVVENGTFNAYHPIVALAGNNDTKTRTEGVWLGSNAAINTYNSVHTSQLIRRREEKYQPVINTTARLMKGQLIVDQHTDIDNLILKSGTFAFRNIGNVEAEELERDMRVTNDITVNSGVNFLVNGTSHPNSGKVIIGEGSGNLFVEQGARIALSNTNLTATDDRGEMNLDANLFLKSGSTLDLRTSDAGSDMIDATGTVNFADRLRLIVRNMKEGTPYQLVHADGGVNVPSDFQVSFRWHDTVFNTPNGQDLYLTVGHITTLKEELEAAGVSKNVLGIGGYISDNWDGSYGPWDDVFYATSVDGAVKSVSEYVPDGYVAAPQVALRTSQNFHSVMAGELGDMRRLRPMGSQRNRIAPSMQDRSPVYRGRAGGDRYGERPMYQPYVRNKYQAYTPDYSGRSSANITSKGSYRTNKGGLWAKPFYVTTTQDGDKGISGYDYDAYGLALGLDHRFGRWTWGLAGVYARGNFEQDNSVIESDVDTLGVGIYGSFKPTRSGFFTDVFASYLKNKNKATHTIKSSNAKLKADYDTNSIGAGIAFGYDFALAQSLYLTPKIGFNYARLSADDVKEKGNAPLVMRVKNPNVNSFQLPVELRVAFPVAAKRFELLPELHVRYTHDFGDTDYQAKAYPNGSEEAIELDNAGMPENLFTVGGGISYISGAHELSGYYDYDFGDGLTSHIFNVGYKFLF